MFRRPVTASALHRHDARPSLLDLVERSLQLGSPARIRPHAIPVEFVDDQRDAAAEAYITHISVDGDVARVDLLLDHGLPGSATLPESAAAWLGLEEGQIVPVRVDRWAAVE